MILLSWIIIGIVLGLIMHNIHKPSRGGLIGSLILGITATMTAVSITTLSYGHPITNINSTSLILGFIGAFILVNISHMFTKIS